MNSRALRRLATDHGALHNQPLPPNYLFAPGPSHGDDLTQLDILLAGPTHTPFSDGVWKLHLNIPAEYPQQPPTAYFRTTIFHPNVDPQTGGVCVETLKRDWDSKLTLRDVLVTISCLLIHPNPDSALNAEAGALIQEDYGAFARRAELMTSIHAIIPKAMEAEVREAQNRGREDGAGKRNMPMEDAAAQTAAPARRRRATARQRGTTTSRTSDGSPTNAVSRPQSFVLHTRSDDIFGLSSQQATPMTPVADEDSSMMDADQENDETKSPTKPTTPRGTMPTRPQGVSVPLGELTMEDVTMDSKEDDEEPEYPPSPRKSPRKSPVKRKPQPGGDEQQAESSREALQRNPNITPPNNPFVKPLAEDSPFVNSKSPSKARHRPQTPGAGVTPLFPRLTSPMAYGGIWKAKVQNSAEKQREKAKRIEALDAQLWELCGRDVRRWNRGDFDGEPFQMKAKRW